MMCQACERGDHDQCGMQTWCECDCEGYVDHAKLASDIEGLSKLAAAEKAMNWNKIIQGTGKSGCYLVAYLNCLYGTVTVGTGTCVDGEWRQGAYEKPIAWLPLPEPPTLESLGLTGLTGE